MSRGSFGFANFFEPTLADGIECHDPRAPLCCFSQTGQHARVVRSGVLAKYEYGIRAIEIIQRDGSLARAEGFLQGHAARFVAHIRAIRQIVRAKGADKELIEKGGFVAGASGGVERCLIRCRQVA